jgi:hypothetical protein
VVYDPFNGRGTTVVQASLMWRGKGFFSVYTLPPNQAMSAKRQMKVNARLKQKHEYRDVKN